MKTPFLYQARALLVAAVLPLVASAAAESPSLLLQKGIYAEEIERNLDSAIKIYEQIAAESAANRAVVAQAQYRLAVCYQKQGKKEQAIKLLNELVQRFPSELEIIKSARVTLAALGQTGVNAVSVRKIPCPMPPNLSWEGVPGFFPIVWAVSPDGRFISYAPRPKGTIDVVVGEIATGKTWTIVEGNSATKSPSWSGVCFSPDGQRVVYDAQLKAVNVAKIDGTENHRLYECKSKDERIEILGWSADGSRVIVDQYEPKTEPCRIFSLEVKTGVREEIAQLPITPQGVDISVSHDGRYAGIETGGKFTLLDLKSGRQGPIVDSDVERFVGWSSRDGKLLYGKKGLTGFDLMGINVVDGKPSGAPELIFNKLPRAGSLGITADDSIYYRVVEGRDAGVWVMEGFLNRAAPTDRRSNQIPTDEILTAGNVINDRALGFSAALPAGWAIKSARRLDNGGNEIELRVPESAEAQPKINYRLGAMPGSGPAPTTPAEIDTGLKKFAGFIAGERKKANADYKIRPASYVTRTIDGHRTLSWTADYSDNGKPWIEQFISFHGEKMGAAVRMLAPAAVMDAILPAFEQLAESVRLP